MQLSQIAKTVQLFGLKNDMPVLSLAGRHFGKWKNMQVRFHDIMDGSSLARAIHVPTGPLQTIEC